MFLLDMGQLVPWIDWRLVDLLCRKKTNDTCFHTHIPTSPAWNHVPHVEENTLRTPKQASKAMLPKNGTAFNCILVAPRKPPHPHKEKKPILPLSVDQSICSVCVLFHNQPAA
jgi:hypothetical protein